DAGTSLLKDMGSSKADIVCDAIAKAHVDDQGQIVLTPRTEGPATHSNDSVEELVRRAWAVVMQGAHLRHLRALGYALDGNPVVVLSPSVSPDSFGSAQEANQYLRKFWQPVSSRHLFWPSAARKDGRFAPGDFGVFDPVPRKGIAFRKLGSVAHELGGVKTTVQFSDLDEVKSNVFRLTCHPNGQKSQDELLKEGFMFSWSNGVKDEATECDWWRLNVRKLAESHDVPPESLVLVTKTVHGLDSTPLEHLSRHIQQPIHFQLSLDDSGAISEECWSFSDATETERGDQEVQKQVISPEIPLPKLNRHFGEYPFPARYIQLEALDLEFS
ncbi:hypothetical protein FRC04_001361, partial [Tulasnella sp. 424]